MRTDLHDRGGGVYRCGGRGFGGLALAAVGVASPDLVPCRRFAATRDPQLDVDLLGEAGTFGEARAVERAIRGAALM